MNLDLDLDLDVLDDLNLDVLMERLTDRNISFLPKLYVLPLISVCTFLCSLRAISIFIHSFT